MYDDSGDGTKNVAMAIEVGGVLIDDSGRVGRGDWWLKCCLLV